MTGDPSQRAAPSAGLVLLLIGLGPASAQAQGSFGAPPPSATPSVRAPPPQRPDTVSPAARTDPSRHLERQEFGVPPTNELHTGAMHGPTPGSIPGGKLITTQELVPLRRSASSRALVFDVLGGPEVLPGALAAVPAHQPGSFSGAIQREFGRFLDQVTRGRKDASLVFYCQSVQCWMSYNASLRAIRLGYTHVLWYRGGIEAWKSAGQAVQSAQGPAR